MKKILNIIILFLGMFYLNIGLVSAASATLVPTGLTTAKAGDIITINIRLDVSSYEGLEGLMYCKGLLTFNKDYISFYRYVTFNNISDTYDNPQNGNYAPGKFAFDVTTLAGDNYYVGHLIAIEFKINDDVPNDTIVKFVTESMITRMRDPSDLKGYSDMYTTGSTLEIKITNTKKDDTTSNNSMQNNNPSMNTSKKSDNNFLKSIYIDNYDIELDFDKDIFEYNITIPFEVNLLDIKFEVEDSKAKSEITGNNELQVGSNRIAITVTAEDGSKKEYTIIAIRSDEETLPIDILEDTVAIHSVKPKGKDNLIVYIIGGSIVVSLVVGVTTFLIRKKNVLLIGKRKIN